MSNGEIQQNVSQFFVDHINSVEQLEVLLLLHAQPSREWTAEQIATELRTRTESVVTHLAELKRISIIEEISSTPPAFRFALSSKVASLIDSVAQEYKNRRVSVISLIYTKPPKELREFSDAFRIKKKEES